MINWIIIGTLVPLSWALCIWITKLIADNKGYDTAQAVRAGLFLGVFAIVVYLFLPERVELPQVTRDDMDIATGLCPKCLKRTSFYEGFCTVCGTKVEQDGLRSAVVDRPRPESDVEAESVLSALDKPANDEPLAPVEEVTVADPAPEAFCVKCASTTRHFDGFCTVCGTQLAGRTGQHSAARTEADGAVDNKLCPYCGVIREFSGMVCTACGNSISGD